jgi:prophage tail gpP-like protein
MYGKDRMDRATIKKIISGGQTGADQAALKAARALGLLTGGTAPKGFLTSAGRNVSLGTEFGLKEMVGDFRGGGGISRMFIERSKKNVDDADATLVFRSYASSGTDKTIGYCMTGRWIVASERDGDDASARYRPVYVVRSLEKGDDATRERCLEEAKRFVRENRVETLNVAGHREDASRNPARQSFESLVEAFVKDLLAPCPTRDIQDSSLRMKRIRCEHQGEK